MDEVTVEELRNKIDAAFAGLDVPPANALICPHDPRDSDSANRVRAELVGKPWQSLTAEFLEKRWAGFCYLTPQAYRYYLPALLVGALDRLPSDKGLTHSVVFSLRPCFYRLFFAGDDAKLRARQACFTPGQYRAVCDFLGFILGSSPRLRYLAAQGLRWGWAAIETPALEEALAFYRMLHHFPARPITDPERARLAEQIRAAFADTPRPDDQQLCDYGDDEANEVGMECRGVDWRALHPHFLARNDTALTFLSDAGFRYFMPAFLLAELADYDPKFNSGSADPCHSLTRDLEEPDEAGPDEARIAWLVERLGKEQAEFALKRGMFTHTEEKRSRQIQRLSVFSRVEREAIIAYLEYEGRDDVDEPDNSVRRALDSYWRPSLAAGD